MANAIASVAGLNVISQPSAFASSSRAPLSTPPSPLLSAKKTLLLTRCSVASPAQPSDGGAAASTRRSVLGLLATAIAAGSVVKSANAASDIKIAGPPPPSGGLPGTENADQARDLDLPLKERFFIQPLTPVEAVSRIKESAVDIVGVKDLIAKKQWPYVQNDLRNKASYLRYDLNTIIASKPKEEKKSLKALTSKLFETIDKLDYAARSKSQPAAEKYYAETVSALNTVIDVLA